jgi:predicted MFS family arabinose efflux permease
MLPPERRGAAISFIFLGWSVATVAGMPLGSLIGATIGWRWAYGLLAVLSLAALAGVLAAVPRELRGQRLSLASWKGVLLDPVLVPVLLVTVASLSGQFALFTFVAPVLRESLAATPSVIAAVMAWSGAWGVLGNSLAARFTARLGVAGAVLFMLACISTGLLLWPLGWGSLALTLLASAVWGFGTFASNSLQQGRLMALAPPLASASIALNTSGIYVGQAVGGATGSALAAEGRLDLLSWAGVGFMILAMACSAAAGRLAVRRPAA